MQTEGIEGWAEIDNRLMRSFEFADFVEAFRFLNRLASVAEEQNHHPEIYNVYNKVTITLTTHDAGNKVTEKDHKLAEAINQLL